MPVAAAPLLVVGAAVAGAAVAYSAIKAQMKIPETGELDRGVDLARKLDADYSREVGVGVFATGGSGVYDTVSGTDNKYAWRVSALSDFEITGFREIWINGERGTLTGDPLSGWVECSSHFLKEDGSPSFRVRLMPGTMDQQLDSELSSAAGSDLTSSDRFTGIAIAITRQEFDAENNLTSEPSSLVWVLEGAPVHDPSDPASDPEDDATWSRTSDARFNTALQIAQAIRGWKRNGEIIVGCPGIVTPEIPEANLIAAADECDEAVAVDDQGGTEPRYRSGGLIRMDKDRGIRPSLEKLFAAMAGDLIETGGLFKLLPGVERVPEHTFDIDALGGRVLAFDPHGSATDRKNECACTIVDPDNAYQELPLPAYKPSEYLADDFGRRNVLSVGLAAVSSRHQGTRIQHALLEEARRFGSIKLELPLIAMTAEPGDWMTVTSRLAGIADSVWKIEKTTRTSRGKVIIEATAIDVTPWNWTGTDASAVFNPGYPVSPVQPVPRPVTPSITLTAGTVSGGGAVEPAIRAEWTLSTSAPLDTTVEFQWRKVGETDFYPTAIDKNAGAALLREGVLPGIDMEVRARLTGGNGRSGQWSDWATVTIGDDYTVPLAIGGLYVGDPSGPNSRLAEQVIEQIDGAQAEIDAARDQIKAGSDDLQAALEGLKESVKAGSASLDEALAARADEIDSARDFLAPGSADLPAALDTRFDLVKQTTDQLNSDIRAQIRDTQRSLALSAKTLLTFDVVQEYTREISASVGNFSATFISDIQTLSSEVASLVTQVEAWTAVNVDGDITSALLAEIDARVAGDNANASNITTAQTTANNALARANDAVALNVSPSSALAQRFSGLDSDVDGLTTSYNNIVTLQNINGTAIQNLLNSLDSERDPDTPGSLRAQIDEAKQTQIADNLARVAAERRMRALVGRSMVSFEALQIAQASDTEAVYQEFERVDLAVASNTASFESILDMSVDPSSAFITRFTAAEAELDSGNAGSIAAKTASLENIVLTPGTGHVDRIEAIELDLDAGEEGSFAAKVETHDSVIYDGSTGILQRLGVLEGDSDDFSTQIATLQQGQIDQERALAREIRRVRAQSARTVAALETQTEAQARENEAALLLIETAQVGVDANASAFQSVINLSVDPSTALAQRFSTLDAKVDEDLPGAIEAVSTEASEALASAELQRAREARRLAAKSARGEAFTETTRLAQQSENEAISGRVDRIGLDFTNYQAEVEETFLAKTDFDSTLAAYTLSVNASTRTLAEHLAHIEDTADQTAEDLANNYLTTAQANAAFTTAAEVNSAIGAYQIQIGSSTKTIAAHIDDLADELDPESAGSLAEAVADIEADYITSTSLNDAFSGIGLNTSATYNIERDLYGEAGVSTGISAAASLFLNSFVDVTDPDNPAMLSQFTVELGVNNAARLRGVHDGSTSAWQFESDLFVLLAPEGESAPAVQPFVYDSASGTLKLEEIVVTRVDAEVIDADQIIGGAVTESWYVSSNGNLTNNAGSAGAIYAMLSTPYQNRGISGVGGALFNASGYITRAVGSGTCTVAIAARSTDSLGGSPTGVFTTIKSFVVSDDFTLSVDAFTGLIGEFWEIALLFQPATAGDRFTLRNGFVGVVELRR